MLKRILLAVSLLLWAESTGYAAGKMIEIMELGIPAARRALSTVRPLSFFSAHMPFPDASVRKRYFSHTPGLFSDTHGLLDRSQTVSDKAREPIISKIDHLSVPKTLISRGGEEEKSYKRWKTGAVKIGGDDFVSDFIHADQRCFRTFREKFPELESYICEIRLSLKLVFNYFSDENYTKE